MPGVAAAKAVEVERVRRLIQGSRQAAPLVAAAGWDVRSILVEGSDDLREEVFALQLITLTQQILRGAGLRGYVLDYRTVSTGRTTGIVETITDAKEQRRKKENSKENFFFFISCRSPSACPSFRPG